MSRDNTIYIGRKPVMSYVMATLATFNHNETIQIKARGRSITTAVDVAEITRNRYMTGMVKPEIVIGTEQVEDDRGTRNVSTMTITLVKGDAVVPAEVFRPRERRERRPPRRERSEPRPKPEPEPEPEPVVEDVDISKIGGVGAVTEEKLKAAGYDTVAKVINSEPSELALKTKLTEKQIEKIIAAAKEI